MTISSRAAPIVCPEAGEISVGDHVDIGEIHLGLAPTCTRASPRPHLELFARPSKVDDESPISGSRDKLRRAGRRKQVSARRGSGAAATATTTRCRVDLRALQGRGDHHAGTVAHVEHVELRTPCPGSTGGTPAASRPPSATPAVELKVVGGT